MPIRYGKSLTNLQIHKQCKLDASPEKLFKKYFNQETNTFKILAFCATRYPYKILRTVGSAIHKQN